jgi:hypothetical protein
MCPMIAALVLFDTAGSLTIDDAVERFNSTAPNYRGKDALHSKAYIYEDSGDALGGFYIWESREAAEAMYSDAWKAKATEIYGVAPVIRYFDVPVLIENSGASQGS